MNAARKHNARSEQPLWLKGTAPDFFAYVESNPTPILITNAGGLIEYVNAAWQRLTGYRWEEAVGRNPRFLSSARTPRKVYEKMLASLERGESFESEELIDRRKDGSEFSLQAVFFPVQLQKNTTYYVQVVHDITERKEIEKQKNSFIRIAEHELRNPLSTMMFSLDLLKHELSEPKEAEETIGVLASAMDHFRSLFSYLVDVNKIHADALNIHREKKDLGSVVERIAAEIRVAFPSHTVIIEQESLHPYALFDEDRIGQVITNLISNAIKYSPNADRVIIRLADEAGSVHLSVQDFGIGIPKDEQEKVFDMLYRAKNRGSIQGAGLGLYISAQILAAHGAHLSVASEEGVGSTFHFSLPLAP